MYQLRKGLLYNKLLYRKYGRNKKKKERSKNNQNEVDEQRETSDHDVLESLEGAVAQMTLEEELSCLLYFKTCLVEREMDILKIRMK